MKTTPSDESEKTLRQAIDFAVLSPIDDVARAIMERDSLRELLRQTIVYLDARVGNKPDSRGYALLQRLNAALTRKD